MSKKSTIAVINKAGKAGKSTLAKQLIAPILGAHWYQIETINEQGSGSTKTVGGQKISLIAEVVAMNSGNLVIDIGVSNYESALKEMEQLDEFTQEIDFWVIPAQPIAGHLAEAIGTIEDLVNRLGVDPGKIVIIPNAIENSESLADDYEIIIRAAEQFGFHFVNAAVVQNPMFQQMSGRPKSIIEFADEVVDWRALIDAEKNEVKKAKLAADKTAQSKARFIARNLRAVWASSPLATLTATEAA